MTRPLATVGRVPSAFKSAYLIHGDDHGRIAERRAALRALAERQSGAGGVEVFEGDTCTPEAVAGALSAMTFAVGRRFVIADGVERWKDAQVEPVVAALAGLDAETMTVTFFAREDGRLKAPPPLARAVAAAGGVVAAEMAVKPRELPRWVVDRAAELDLRLDTAGARALIAHVGDRQQRLQRELETLALELGPGATADAGALVERSAGSAERKAWTLADAIVAGDQRLAMRALVELRGQGERVGGLVYTIVRRLRDAHEAASGLAAGESPAQIKGRLRMPPFVADRLIADVRGRDVDGLRLALEHLADLELESRGGGSSALSDDTAAVRVVAAIAVA